MSTTLIALVGDYPGAMRHYKSLVCDELAEPGRRGLSRVNPGPFLDDGRLSRRAAARSL